MFNPSFAVDCSLSSPVTELNGRHFLHIGTFYLYVQAKSTQSPTHPDNHMESSSSSSSCRAYPQPLKQAKAGTSVDERDRRLYETFSLKDYELPFICLINTDGKSTFSMVIHDYKGYLMQYYENDTKLRTEFMSSLQPSSVEKGFQSDELMGDDDHHHQYGQQQQLETPVLVPFSKTESSFVHPLKNDFNEKEGQPTGMTKEEDNENEKKNAHDSIDLSMGILNDKTRWMSLVLNKHVSVLQDELELCLFEAKNRTRMQKILETKEMEQEALVDSTRCKYPSIDID